VHALVLHLVFDGNVLAGALKYRIDANELHFTPGGWSDDQSMFDGSTGLHLSSSYYSVAHSAGA